MTPGEHYAEAEDLLARADECAVASIARQMTAKAAVHAALAQCAPMYVVNSNVTTRQTDERL